VRVLIVSPHFDDAPLSLGQSMIDGALSPHRVTVGIVFGRTSWVRWFHPTRSRAPVAGAIRRAEELHAAMRFRYRVRIAGFEEAILRLDTTDPAIYLDHDFDADESPLMPAVREAIDRWSGDADQVVFPLGVGGHVDHKLCATVGRELSDRGTPVAFYEERPYRAYIDDDAVAALASRLDPGLERRDASGDITSTKRRRLFYPSQFDALFEDAAAIDQAEGRREHVWVSAGAAWP
jgi:LmbE family N-acetylglucosaminyl deacetylase